MRFSRQIKTEKLGNWEGKKKDERQDVEVDVVTV